jgi:hypothetical protein
MVLLQAYFKLNMGIRKGSFIRDKRFFTFLSILISMRAGFSTQRRVFYKLSHIQTLLGMRFEVLMAVKMLMLVFWIITLCGPVRRYQQLRKW